LSEGPAWGEQLTERVTDFARLLRRAGLPTGPGDVLNAMGALASVNVTRPHEFYWALHAVFVRRSEHRPTFYEAFRLFWSDRPAPNAVLDELMSLSKVPVPPPPPLLRRLAEAWAEGGSGADSERERVEVDMRMTYSEREALSEKDFEQMSVAEIEAAREAIARMRLPIRDLPTRRRSPSLAGSEVDLRRTLRATLRAGGATIPLQWRARRLRPPPLVALCDISGSMSGYTRMLLHFLHALTNDRDRVHTFLFGTRLTNATRHLRHRDGDVALERLQKVVQDWDGGTRIGACIEEFNHSWSRRVLGQGAVVLLITDGLDREGGEGLGAAMDRLHRSCRRLIWLNPLLRYEEFQPEAQGIRAILPHVDDFRAVHSLNSLRELARALSVEPTPARRGAGATSGTSGAESETKPVLSG
jgi:uncharacterized protein with von Willebrand factor type A (vWA) domain